MKRKCILIDIDGTLSNCSHREPYLKLEKPLNRKFFNVNEMEKESLSGKSLTRLNHLHTIRSPTPTTVMGIEPLFNSTTSPILKSFAMIDPHFRFKGA